MLCSLIHIFQEFSYDSNVSLLRSKSTNFGHVFVARFHITVKIFSGDLTINYGTLKKLRNRKFQNCEKIILKIRCI